MFSKQHNRSSLLSALIALMLLLTNVSAAAASGKSAASSCDQVVRFESDEFTQPTKINNKWMPLVPGTQFIFEGRINQRGGPVAVPHQVVFTVTDLTKVVDGVRTVVVWDRDFDDGQLVEAELAFFAQDKDGNVWNLGEYPEEYVDGVFEGAPNTWIAGQAGAKAGIHMFANPKVGSPSYLQGITPKIAFLDCGQVADNGQSVDAPFGHYENVLVTNEWSPREPDSGIQVKYYAPGVGNVQIGGVDDPEAETLVLVDLVSLSPDALAEARNEALTLDSRAYEVSQVYRKTSPAKQRSHDEGESD
jgi:ketosteroid isomerase-like protein